MCAKNPIEVNVVKSSKCKQCGLVNPVGASNCKRCDATLGPDGLAHSPAVGNQETPRGEKYDPADFFAGERPLWVRVGLWKCDTWSVAIAFLVISLLITIGATAFLTWWGLVGLLAAAWYFFAIRWIDKNDTWGKRCRVVSWLRRF